MANREIALDIAEPQVAVDFEDDAVLWHQRILLLKLSDDGRWVAASPDWEIEVIDLTRHRVVPLTRSAEFPARVRGNIYFTGEAPEAELAAAHRDARALASVLGSVPGAAASLVAEWYFSDTAFERFGEEVPGDLTRNPATMLSRDSVALIAITEEGAQTWTTAERVLAGDLESWKEEKASGPGRDPRVLPVQRDARSHRYRTLRDALTVMTPLSREAPVDWPFRGPSAVMEVLVGARAAGEDLGGYHDFYLRTSGLHQDHPVAHKHRDLWAVLQHLICFDQCNAPQLASAEMVARLILQCHQAVKRNPKNPDFKGTALIAMSRLDSQGGILTGEFARFVADEQKAEAFTLKQQRLYAEEEEKRAAAKKADAANPADGAGGGKKK